MPKLSKGKTTLYFLGFCFLAFFLGSFEFFAPISSDTAIFGYYARQINQGGVLYGDLWQFKTPGIYYFFAFLSQIFPDSIHAARTVLFLFNLAAALILYRSARLKAGQTAALTVSAFYLFLTNLSGYFNGDGPYPESFFPIFGILGYFFWSKFEFLGSKKYLFLAGAMAGALFSFKQTSLSFAAVCGLILLYNTVKKCSIENLKNISIFFVGCLCIPAAWVPYFCSQGVELEKLFENFFIYPRFYTVNDQAGILFLKLMLACAFPMSVALFFSLKSFMAKKKPDVFLLLWLGIGLFFVFLPRRGYDRYMLEALIPILLLSLGGLENYFKRLKSPQLGMILIVFLCFIVVGLSQRSRLGYLFRSRILKKELVRGELVGDYFRSKKDYSKFDSIVEWSDHRVLYYSDMKSALSFIDVISHTFGAAVNPLNFEKLAGEWCKNPPRYFVDHKQYSLFESDLSTPKMRDFLRKNYEEVEDVKFEAVFVYQVKPKNEIVCS